MNTRQEIHEHLKEMLNKEGEAFRMYTELASEVNNAALKNFFLRIAEEEKYHEKLVGELMAICGEG
ncbi:MAG: hypothetical protein GTN38_03790 [Candidatus Aenigmarchaeota archaeon]|nr:hypothetical protein [Candidatus Aenigmarchaeota archaeon]NIQ17374.1 hypothetical protein [Candidatus Aenigmarchaeota archaeon]NIS73487.1 hypothetical protein [Candidatus Aenigmarchaeota archaeon]